jgi:hypothetical protein
MREKNPWLKLLANVKSTAGVKEYRRTARPDGTIPPLPEDYVHTRIEIDEIFLEQLFGKQNGRCYWFTEIELDPMLLYVPYHPMAISVDRLVSKVTENEGHYTEDNVVLTTRFCNFGRGCYDGNFRTEVVDVFKNAILNPTDSVTLI